MVLPKRRILLAVLLGTALTALLVDRVLLGSAPASVEPDAALAVGPAGDLAAPAGAAFGQTESPPTVAPETALAERLQELAASGGLDALAVRDAFQPPQAWLTRAPKPQAAPNADELLARKFAERHRLHATAVAPDGHMALIDDQCLIVGQALDGFELVSVGRDTAELACGDVRVVLRLEKPAKPGR